LLDNAGFPTTKPRDSALRAITKEAAGIHVLPTRLLFGDGIPRRLLRRVSLAKPTSALLRFQPLLEQIKAGIQAARVGPLRNSALAKACDYTLTLWIRLNRFLEHPELELSNNLAEKCDASHRSRTQELDPRRK
jgi:hypothetical protein